MSKLDTFEKFELNIQFFTGFQKIMKLLKSEHQNKSYGRSKNLSNNESRYIITHGRTSSVVGIFPVSRR